MVHLAPTLYAWHRGWQQQALISALPTLGVEAMVLSVFATLGSCALAWALWKTAKGGNER